MEIREKSRTADDNANFEGKQPPISVIYGKDPVYMTSILLETIDLKRLIPAGASTALKPNLVVSKKSDSGATTTPEILETVISYLKKAGFNKISIIEGSWLAADTRKAFKKCGFEAISKTYQVPLVDTKSDSTTTMTVDGYSIDVCNSALNADVLINFPVLKGHGQALMTGALKNLKGVIPDKEKRRFHSEGLNEPIARLNQMVIPTLHIMDAICGDLGFEEGGSPSTMHRMMVCNDPVMLDSYGCDLMYLETEEVPYIGRAHELGVGELFDPKRESELVLHLNEPETDYSIPKFSRDIPKLVDQDLACSSCYGSLFQALLDTDEETWKRIEKRFEENGRKPLFSIGQGFKGKEWEIELPMGIGVCTKGGANTVTGCPPDKESILTRIAAFF